MTIQASRVMMYVCLALVAIAAQATEPAQTEALQTPDSVTAAVEVADSVHAEEIDAAETADTEAVQAEERSKRGIFSRIVEWFRGETTDTAPEPVPEQEAPEEAITLSHVYQATLDMVAEIEILRKATGVVDDPREMNPRKDQAPIYAYSKSFEVLEKTARVQRRFGMIPVDVGHIPVKRITSGDVYRSVKDIIKELRRIKRQLVVEDEIQPASFAGGKTPSLVYKNLGDASFLLDGLVGRRTTPNDVYMHILRVQDEMQSIATGLETVLDSDPPAVEEGKEPTAVAQQILRATYKAINLQSRLGMDASSLPNSTLVEATPADLLDAANILLVEIVRIRLHLNVRSPRIERPESRDMQSTDVFAQVLLTIRNLDIMSRTAGNT